MNKQAKLMHATMGRSGKSSGKENKQYKIYTKCVIIKFLLRGGFFLKTGSVFGSVFYEKIVLILY
jgi:hypothetical protein